MPSQAIEPRTAAPTLAGPSSAPGHTIPESASAEQPEELRLQIRELTQSNLDLRDRLTQQSRELKDLKEELGRLRRELDRAKPKSPTPKKPVP
jgi:predicted RNase H-like nuclease (RuvC/YqgF family)